MPLDYPFTPYILGARLLNPRAAKEIFYGRFPSSLWLVMLVIRESSVRGVNKRSIRPRRVRRWRLSIFCFLHQFPAGAGMLGGCYVARGKETFF